MSSTPRYLEIADYLRQLVARAQPGARLPSDAELCERFGVSRMTARQAVAVLANEQLLERIPGSGTYVSERPPISRTQGERFLGLDLGGTNIKTAVVEESPAEPAVIATASHPTHADRGPDFVTDRLIEVGRRTIAEHGPVTGAGLGVPGLFEADTGRIVLFPNLPGPWRGHSLREPVGAGLGVPTVLINDARAFLLAEGTLGAGKGHNPVIGLTLGTGIGGGVMIDGKIRLGAFGTGGELGHQIIVPDGPPCGCGSRGCVEALARSDRLAEMAGMPDVGTVYERAAAGDEQCLAAIDKAAGYIGIGIANAITVLGPSCVVIGGGIATAGDLILDPIRRAVREHVFLAPRDGAEIVPAELGNWAGAIGAALAGRSQFETRAR